MVILFGFLGASNVTIVTIVGTSHDDDRVELTAVPK